MALTTNIKLRGEWDETGTRYKQPEQGSQL